MRRIWMCFWMVTCVSCASLTPQLEKPVLNLKTVEVAGLDSSKVNLVFRLDVQNPNTVPVAVDRVQYALKLNDRSFTEGVLEKGLKVGPQETVEIPVPVSIPLNALVSSFSDFLNQGASNYELQGSVKWGLLSLPFSQKGVLKLSDFQK